MTTLESARWVAIIAVLALAAKQLTSNWDEFWRPLQDIA
jgi:hypothetical protein